MPKEIPALATPAHLIPKGTCTCNLSMIDTSCYLTVPADTLHQSSGRQLLFDLGCRKDFRNLPAPIADVIDLKVPGIKVDSDLADILIKGATNLKNIEAAIVSHHHYDHTGNPAALVVGPGFSDAFMPGYPTNQDSPLYENAFKGRDAHEMDFSDCQIIAGYPARDFFGDGSLYILSTPGHAIGHISALVRTDESSFAFLGAEICHFGGSFRPTLYLPMPSSISSSDLSRDDNPAQEYPPAIFTGRHPKAYSCRTTPYYEVCAREDSWHVNPPVAGASIDKLKSLDANGDVLVLIAHDPIASKVLPLFPAGTLNVWELTDWKTKLRWGFLDELPQEDRKRKYLVDGTYRKGKLVKPLDILDVNPT
ncbi:metallo-beta-lactamase superfamily protein [Verticillium alfalfae VaMs.102]|uniref:Metallo-beta-lactamase superfamily protein n=1 Tax=Verticillium alfalfae (strain VaMs.102 / ATCC MYA-4576 / FGSC 10136) TaxID=526221 RepID=C9SMR5_VERA1|nr:metallo-beta-lactamase superfamily protein [Verticillium alfalfae VaMs.102]EEY20080.1 metallo-beta-lactamase superfamily protein [Verticillium alfalfae VaMs.102]